MFFLYYRTNATLHTQATLSDGHHLSSVCCCQLPQPREVLGFSVLLKLTAAGGMAADGAEELIFIKVGKREIESEKQGAQQRGGVR